MIMKNTYKIQFFNLPFTHSSDDNYTDINKILSYKKSDFIQYSNDATGWNWNIEFLPDNIFRIKVAIDDSKISNLDNWNFVVIDFGDDKNIFKLQKVGFWNVGDYKYRSINSLVYTLEINAVFSYGKEFLTQIEGKQVKVNSAHLNVLIKNNDKLKSIIFDKNIKNNVELQAVLNGKEFEGDNYLKNDNKTKIYDPLKFIIKLKHENIIINDDTFNSIDWRTTWLYKWREFFLEIYGRNLPWQDSDFTKDYVGIKSELTLYDLWFDKNWKYLCFLYTFFYIQTGNRDNNGYSSNISVLLNNSKVVFQSVKKDNFSSKNPNVFPLMTQQSYNNIIKPDYKPFLEKVNGDDKHRILTANTKRNVVEGDWEWTWEYNKDKWKNDLMEVNDFETIKQVDDDTYEIYTKQIIFGGRYIKDMYITGYDRESRYKLNDFNVEVFNKRIYSKRRELDDLYNFRLNYFLWSPTQRQLDFHTRDGLFIGGFGDVLGRVLYYIDNSYFDGIWENFYKTTIKRDGTKTKILDKQVFRTKYTGGAIITYRDNMGWDMSGYVPHIVSKSFNYYKTLFNKRDNNVNEKQSVYYLEPVYNATHKYVSYKKGDILSNVSEPHLKNLDEIIRSWFNKHKYDKLSANLGFQKTEIIKAYFTEHSNFFLDISDSKMNIVAEKIINNVKLPSLNDINNTLSFGGGLNNILSSLVMKHKKAFNFDCFYLRQVEGGDNLYLLNDFEKVKYQNLEYNLQNLDETQIYKDNKDKKIDDILHTAYALEIYTPELLNYHLNEIVMRNGDKFLINNYDVINDMTTIFFQNTISGQLWLFDNQLRRTQNKLVNSLEVPIVENQLEIQKRHFQKELDVENSKLDLEDKKLRLSREREVSSEKYNLIRSGTNVGTSALGVIGSIFQKSPLGFGASVAGLTNSAVSLDQTLENQKLSKRAHSLNLESRSLARQDYQNQLTRKSFAIESTGISDAQSIMKDEFRAALGLEHKELGIFDKKKIAEYHHLFGTQLQFIDVFNKNKYLNRTLFNYLSLANIKIPFTKIPTPFLEMVKTNFNSGVRIWNNDYDTQKLNWQKGLD